jgi:outer membrane protein assembly factor BamB
MYLFGRAAVPASDWTHWRGPERNGTSSQEGLVSSWSVEGENLIWRADFVGRSTPVVLNGRVCANGRTGEGILRQEMVACFDAETGEKLWERRFNVYHSSVPWTRVGWANLAADAETGHLYVQGVGGLFFCLDSTDGSVVWKRKLIEEFGFMEGYGGSASWRVTAAAPRRPS